MKLRYDSRPIILIAEDDPLIRNLLRTALQPAYNVLVAPDGLAALRLSRAHKGPVDLLLTDVEMPGMEGPSLHKQLIAERTGLKVLFISGSGTFRDDVDPRPFLAKPFLVRDLRARVAELITPRRTILVVDENARRRARTIGILERDGFDVITARNTKEATALSDGKGTVDLIVAAVEMDGSGNGVDLAEHVDASSRNISTLLISHVDVALLRREVAGFAAQPEFLANPFSPEELLERVHRLMRRSQAGLSAPN